MELPRRNEVETACKASRPAAESAAEEPPADRKICCCGPPVRLDFPLALPPPLGCALLDKAREKRASFGKGKARERNGVGLGRYGERSTHGGGRHGALRDPRHRPADRAGDAARAGLRSRPGLPG